LLFIGLSPSLGSKSLRKQLRERQSVKTLNPLADLSLQIPQAKPEARQAAAERDTLHRKNFCASTEKKPCLWVFPLLLILPALGSERTTLRADSARPANLSHDSRAMGPPAHRLVGIPRPAALELGNLQRVARCAHLLSAFFPLQLVSRG